MSNKKRWGIPELEGTPPFIVFDDSQEDYPENDSPMNRAKNYISYGYVTESGVCIFKYQHDSFLISLFGKRDLGEVDCFGRLFNHLHDNEKKQFINNFNKICSAFKRLKG